MLYATRYMLHATRYVLHVTRYMLHSLLLFGTQERCLNLSQQHFTYITDSLRSKSLPQSFICLDTHDKQLLLLWIMGSDDTQ